MKDVFTFSHFYQSGCTFSYDAARKVLRVTGKPTRVQRTIRMMIRKGMVAKELNGIWFSHGDVITLLRGPNITIFIASDQPAPKPLPRKFTDIVSSSQ